MRAAALACAILAGAARASAAPPVRGVILISVDALRADRVGARRQGASLTPALDALAASGTRFLNAVAQAPWTLPSMATVFTSLTPHRHRLTNRFAEFGEASRILARLPPRARTLAQAFSAAGYDTAAFTGDAGLDKAYDFDRGFDVYYDSVPFAGYETTMPLAIEWLKARGPRPFFLFLHGYDVHGQYLHPELDRRFQKKSYAGRFRGTADEWRRLRRATIEGSPTALDAEDREFWSARYDEQVARADARIGRFLRDVAEIPGLSSGTLVAVMSDHGDELFDHGGVDHGMTLYDEVLRVVLIVAGQGVPARRVPEQVRLMDLAPTLLDLAGVRDPAFHAQAQGVSLRPLLEGRPLALDSVGETDYLFRSSKRSLRTADGRKLIMDLETLRREGYDLNKDPGETRDLVRDDPSWAAPLQNRLREALELKPERR